jgi:hypothetical protein
MQVLKAFREFFIGNIKFENVIHIDRNLQQGLRESRPNSSSKEALSLISATSILVALAITSLICVRISVVSIRNPLSK